MKATAALLRHRFSALVLTASVAIGVLSAPTDVHACGPYGPRLSVEEHDLVDAAESELRKEETPGFVVSYGAVRIDGDRATVPLQILEEDGSFWQTFAFVRAADGSWVREAARLA